jgi:hypothetical protein
MSVPDVLQRIIAALERADIAYMLSGSFASAYYGAPQIRFALIPPACDFPILVHFGLSC